MQVRRSGIAYETSDFTEEERPTITYNVELLFEAKLIEGHFHHLIGGPPEFLVRRLTWAGHEFLDAIRSENIWNKTKAEAVDKGTGLSFELLKALALQYAKDILGL